MPGGIFSNCHASPALLLTKMSYFEWATWIHTYDPDIGHSRRSDSCKTAQESMVPKKKYLGRDASAASIKPRFESRWVYVEMLQTVNLSVQKNNYHYKLCGQQRCMNGTN